MSISNVGKNIAAYGIQAGKNTASKVDANSIEYREVDKSAVPAKRGLLTSMIARRNRSVRTGEGRVREY